MGLFKSSHHEKHQDKHHSSNEQHSSHIDPNHGYQAPPCSAPGASGKFGHEQPPPGPPPAYADGGYSAEPDSSAGQPYHDWTSVPDTALLPPPPSITNEESPTGNADEVEADRALKFCKRFPLNPPGRPTYAQAQAVREGGVILQKPREYSGRLNSPQHGTWVASTPSNGRDCSLLSTMPLYFASVDNPLRTGRDKTIYFEMKINALGSPTRSGESSLAIGYCAVPYPTWRMPGWERGSLAVHSDDGRRYVSDNEGGIDFTSPFRIGETVGIGVRFSNAQGKGKTSIASSRQLPEAEVFFTRNGHKTGGWDVHEEVDSTSEFASLGIDGSFDLFAAIGVFGGVSFEAIFNPQSWLFRP